MVNEMHSVTVAEWKSVHKRLDDLENIVKELKSNSKLFGNENENLNFNLETHNSVETERVQFYTQPNIISAGSDVDAVINLPGTSSIDQMVQESLTLTSENINGLESAQTSSFDSAIANASTSVMVTEKVIGPPSAPSLSFCFPNGIGLHDQSTFEKSRRAVISLKRCDETETEVLAGKRSFGLKNKRNKKISSTGNTVKRTGRAYPPNIPRKPTASTSNGKGNGECNGSEVPLGEKGKRNKCLICTMKFSTKFNLSIHTRLHTGEKPYTCRLCPNAFNTSSELKSHSRVHTGEKPYQCQFCSKCFSQRTNLKFHINVHTREKPYNCQYCPKTYRQPGPLSTHLRTHTREKPFVCQFCKRSFAFSASLKHHLSLHTAGA